MIKRLNCRFFYLQHCTIKSACVCALAHMKKNTNGSPIRLYYVIQVSRRVAASCKFFPQLASWVSIQHSGCTPCISFFLKLRSMYLTFFVLLRSNKTERNAFMRSCLEQADKDIRYFNRLFWLNLILGTVLPLCLVIVNICILAYHFCHCS